MKEVVFSTHDDDQFEELVNQRSIAREHISAKNDRWSVSEAERQENRKNQSRPKMSELDLHGCTREEALKLVSWRIESRKASSILIIVGKGHNSGERGPVLKNAVKEYLQDMVGRKIKSFAIAPRNRGGSGAFVVKL